MSKETRRSMSSPPPPRSEVLTPDSGGRRRKLVGIRNLNLLFHMAMIRPSKYLPGLFWKITGIEV